MAILTAIVKPISNLKKIIKSMDAIDKKEARLTIASDAIYLDLAIEDPKSTKPVIARLSLNSKWFNGFDYSDRLHFSYPLTFDFSLFCDEVLSCDDTHSLKLFVITSHGQKEFQLRFYDGVLADSDGVKPQKRSNISCELSSDTDSSVRTYSDISELNPVVSRLYSVPAIQVLQSSIQNKDTIDIHLSKQTVILSTKKEYHCFRKGVDCAIPNFNNIHGETMLLRLNLNGTSYVVQALTSSTDVEVIDVLYPTWGKQKELPPILRIWFQHSTAYLDFEFPWESIVHPKLLMHGLWFYSSS